MMSWWCLVLARWHCSHYKPQALHKKSLHPTIRSTSQAPAEALQALRTTSYRATRHFQQDAMHCSENLDFKTSHPAEIRRVEWVEWNTEFSEWYFEYKSLLDNKRLNLDLMALWTCLMISCVVSHPKPETVCSNSPGSFHSLESSSVQSHRAMEIHSMCDINIPDIPEILHITMKLQTCHETAGASTLPKVCKRRIIKVIQSHPILSKHHGLGRWRLRFPCLWSFGLSTYTFFKSLCPALGCGGCPWNSPAKSQSPGPPPLQGATWKTGEFGNGLVFLDCPILPPIWPSKCRNMSLSCHHFEPCQSFLLKKSKMQVEEDLVAQAMERAPRTISASFTWQNAQNTTVSQHSTISIEKLWVLSINAEQKRHVSTFGSSFGSFNTGLMLNSKSHTSGRWDSVIDEPRQRNVAIEVTESINESK